MYAIIPLTILTVGSYEKGVIMTGSLQVKNNKYYMVLNIKVNGKRKPKWIATGLDVKGNKRKAESMLLEYLANAKEEDLIGTKDMLFSEFMLVWLETIKNSIKENTYLEYCKVVKNDICPYFKEKNIRMNQLNILHIQEYYNDLCDRISPNSVHKRHANIHKALDYAVVNNLIDKNPSNYVTLPKKKKFTVNSSSFYSDYALYTMNEMLCINYPAIDCYYSGEDTSIIE
jgi:hypothetical protein